MNKQDILQALNEFPYNRKEYWVVTGGAMVLYGIREQTGDIDLGCSKSMADQLEADGLMLRITENGKRCFHFGEKIEIFEEWLLDSIVMVEGFQIISVDGLLEMKKELGRKKDLKDIELIREHIGSLTKTT